MLIKENTEDWWQLQPSPLLPGSVYGPRHQCGHRLSPWQFLSIPNTAGATADTFPQQPVLAAPGEPLPPQTAGWRGDSA